MLNNTLMFACVRSALNDYFKSAFPQKAILMNKYDTYCVEHKETKLECMLVCRQIDTPAMDFPIWYLKLILTETQERKTIDSRVQFELRDSLESHCMNIIRVHRLEHPSFAIS